jgi:RNA polymerase sigma-70 factor (ECF subfamily)
VFHREPALADGLDLDQALERLEIKYRAVFVLKEMEGYSHEEIGEILGISVNSARVRLYRARQQLREYMRRGS